MQQGGGTIGGRPRRRSRFAMLILGTALIAARPASAGDVSWRYDAATMNWGDAANWAPAAPTAADVVSFNDGIHYYPVFNLGNTTRAVKSLHWSPYYGTYVATFANGTINLAGADDQGYSIYQGQTDQLVLNGVSLGDPAVAAGTLTQVWRANDLVVNGPVIKANAGRAVNLSLVAGLYAGKYTFTNTSIGHADTAVSGASSLNYQPTTGGTYAFGTGTITLGDRCAFGFTGTTDQTYTLTTPLIATGAITLNFTPPAGSTANPSPVLAGPMSFAGDLTINGGGDLKGAIALSGGDRTITSASGALRPTRLSGNITEDVPGRKLSITHSGTQNLEISGTANQWSGGTTIQSVFAGTTSYVVVKPGSSLGTGPVTVGNLGRLRLESLNGLPAGGAVTVVAGSAVEVANATGPVALAAIKSTSTGVFGVDGGGGGFDLAAGGYANLFVGSVTDQTWTTPWTPHGGVYRLIGGVRPSSSATAGPAFTLAAANMLTGPAASLSYGGGMAGAARIAAPQNFGGGTTVDSGILTAAAPAALGTGTVTVNKFGRLTLAAANVMNPAKLALTGGTVTVQDMNAFGADGTVTLTAGTLTLETGAAPGTTPFPTNVNFAGASALSVKGGSAAARVVINDVTIGAAGAGFSTVAADNVPNATAGLTVSGTTTFAPGAPINAGGAAGGAANKNVHVAFDGPVVATSPGPLVFAGSGTIGLFNPANQFTGVTVKAGAVAFDTDAALGAADGLITLSGGAVEYRGATPMTFTRPVSVSPAGASGKFNASGAGDLTIGAAMPLTLAQNAGLSLGGTTRGRLEKPLTGALAPNTFGLSGSATWTIAAPVDSTNGIGIDYGSTLRMGHAAALGTTPRTVFVAGTLDLNGYSPTLLQIQYDNPGYGVVTNSAATPVTFTVDNGGFGGNIGEIPGAGAISLVKTGIDPLALSGTNTYAGLTTVRRGLVGLVTSSLSATRGRLLGTSGVVIAGGQLNTPIYAGMPAPINPAGVPLTLGGADFGGGAFIYTAGDSPSAGVLQPFSTLSLLPGPSRLTTASPATVITRFTAAAPLTRAAGATLALIDLQSTTSAYQGMSVQFATPPTLTNGILGGAYTYNSDYSFTTAWLTVGANGYLVPFTAYAAASNNPNDTSAAGWVAANNLKLTAAPTAAMAASRTVNSLAFLRTANAATVLNLGGGANVLTIGAGGILAGDYGPPTDLITNGTIRVGAAAPDLVVQSQLGPLDIDARLDLGAKALTKAGTNSLTLGNAANSLTDVYLNAGTMVTKATGALGAEPGTIYLLGGNLRASTANQSLAGKQIRVAPAGGSLGIADANGITLDVPGTVFLGGDLTVTGGSQTAAAPSLVRLSGKISGPGALIETNNDAPTYRVEISGDNTFTGGVTLNQFYTNAVTAVASDTALGTGELRATGTVRLEPMNGPRRLPNRLAASGTFSVGGAADLTFTGGLRLTDDLTLVNAGTGVLTIDGPGATGASTITKSGPGRVVLSGSVPTSGSISVAQGVLRLTGTTTSRTVNVQSTGVLEVGASTALQTVNVNDGGLLRLDPAAHVVLTVTSLKPTGTGAVDLADGAMIVNYATTSALAATRLAIAAGSNNGAWTGPGVRSSAAASNAGLAVGYGEASTLLGPSGGTFLGGAADGTSVLVRTTLRGDANLDGAVDFADLVALAQNYNTSATTAAGLWTSGDFNYDGAVDFGDLVALAQRYNTSLVPAAPSAAPAGFDDALAAAFAAVPEPSTAAALLAAAAACASRPRRRQ